MEALQPFSRSNHPADSEELLKAVRPYELGPDFGKLMDQSLVTYGLMVGGPGYLRGQAASGKPDDRRKTLQRRPSMDLSGRFSRLLMHYLGQLCFVDLYGGHEFKCEFNRTNNNRRQAQGTKSAQSTRRTSEQMEQNRPKHRKHRKYSHPRPKGAWWAQVIRCLYFYCAFKALITTCFQYSYDFNVTRYERLQARLAASAPSWPAANVTPVVARPPAAGQPHLQTGLGSEQGTHTSANLEHLRPLLERYERDISHARAWLKTLGAPYMHLRFTIECTYIFFILVSVGLYLQTQVYFIYVWPFDYTLIRSIMNFQEELKICNELIRHEVNKFIESSRVFTSILVVYPRARLSLQSMMRAGSRPATLPKGDNRPASGGGGGGGGGISSSSGCGGTATTTAMLEDLSLGAKRVLMDHSLTIRQLEHMALSGMLMPANKNRAWIRRVAHANSLYTIIYLAYCVCILCLLALKLPSLVSMKLETDPMDILAMAEMLFLVNLVNTSSTFWGSIVLNISLDQVYLVRKLKRKFDRCIHLNTLRLQPSLGNSIARVRNFPPPGSPPDGATEQAATRTSSSGGGGNDDDGNLTYYLKHFDHLRRSRSSYSFMLPDSLGVPPPVPAPGSRPRTATVPSSAERTFEPGRKLSSSSAQNGLAAWQDKIAARSSHLGANLSAANQEFAQSEENKNNNQHLIRLNCCTQMNADVLELLMSYKIFVAQLRPIKRSFGFVALTTSTLMILMPIMGRMHVPYVDGRVKIYVGLLSVLCTFVCDLMILVPVSYLYTQCTKLYKSLSSLLAHTIEVGSLTYDDDDDDELISGTPRGAIYNEHTIFLIRKELNHPDRLVEQFVTVVLGVRITYSNLLKIHFWIGFITQSFLFETSAGATGGGQLDVFGSFFVDPLGLHSI